MATFCSEVSRFPKSVMSDHLQAAAPDPQDNRLLAALPPDVRLQLFPRLQRVWLPAGKTLHEAGDCMRHVYFPIDALVSLSTEMDDGSATEIGAVGNEGLVGLAVILGGDSSPTRALVVNAGFAFSVSRPNLLELFHGCLALQHLFLRFAQAHLTQVAQLAACNRRHAVEQQLCRWLLLRLDRSNSKLLNVTHDVVANLLGVRRESVSQVAGKLQKRGIIHYSRGKLEVVDRARVEQLSCECYFVVRKETDRLLPLAVQKSTWTGSVPIKDQINARWAAQ